MFKNGDKVALRKSPHTLLGTVEQTSHGVVIANGESRWAEDGKRIRNYPDKDDDFVPYEPDPLRYIIIEQEQPSYDALGKARERVDELLNQNPKRKLTIYQAVEELTAEVNINSKRLR